MGSNSTESSPVLVPLLGLTSRGEFIRIDKLTGSAVLVGTAGIPLNAATADPSGVILSGGGAGPNADIIFEHGRQGGPAVVRVKIVGRPPGYGITSMAFDSSARLFVVLAKGAPVDSRLATIDMNTGQCSVVGHLTGGITEISFSPAGQLIGMGYHLYRVDPASAAGTRIGDVEFHDADQSLQFDTDGVLYACRSNLVRIDPTNGTSHLIGATGFSDVRGLALLSD